ncbi:hypothetical protein JCM5353_007331 [Sporobolomyces roseus]
MLSEELLDRLVVATDEQDVLYTLHWLKQIKDGDYSEQLINNKHSWKGYSALESIIQSPFSQLRQFILQMLLLQGVDYRSKEMLELAMECKNLEVLGMILTWDVKGKETGTPHLASLLLYQRTHFLNVLAGDAARLFDLSLQEAGDWIDQNLPTPPNFDSLTGFKPLPAPPSPRSLDSSDSIDSPIEPLTPQFTEQEESVFVKEEESNAPSLRDLSPSSYTTQHNQRDCLSSSLSPIPSSSLPPPFENPFHLPSPIKREAEQDPQPFRLRSSLKRSQGRQSSLFNARPLDNEEEPISSLVTFDSPVRLCLRRLPFGFTPQDVSSLLASIEVECNVYNCHTGGMPAYAFVQVEQDQVSKCLAELDQRQVKHCRISCHVATPDRNPRRSCSQQQQHPKWSPPQIDPFFSNSTSTSSSSNFESSSSTLPLIKEYNLLILNLPLGETLEARQFLSNLPAYSIHLLPSHAQAVAFLRPTSEEKADEIKSLWNLCVVDGKCLEVVDAKNGLSGREAVEAHFGLNERESGSKGKGKRRMSQEEMFEACRKQGKKSRYSI